MLVLKINEYILRRLQHLILSFLIFQRTKSWLLVKTLGVLQMPLMRAWANLKSLTWKCISFPEQYPEQVQIGCITLYKNLCLLLSLCVCASMYERTFRSVKYNVFSVQKDDILNNEGNWLSNQLSSHLTFHSFLSVLEDKSATVYFTQNYNL